MKSVIPVDQSNFVQTVQSFNSNAQRVTLIVDTTITVNNTDFPSASDRLLLIKSNIGLEFQGDGCLDTKSVNSPISIWIQGDVVSDRRQRFSTAFNNGKLPIANENDHLPSAPRIRLSQADVAVEWFGAISVDNPSESAMGPIADGNASAFQNALFAVGYHETYTSNPSVDPKSQNAGTVEIGIGVYWLSRPIRMGSNVRLIGSGQDVTLLKRSNSVASELSDYGRAEDGKHVDGSGTPIDCVLLLGGPDGNQGGFPESHITAIEIAHLHLEGREPKEDYHGNMTQCGIWSHHVSESTIHDIGISMCEIGYYAESYIWNSSISRCRVDVCHKGIFINSSTSLIMQSCFVSHFRDCAYSIRHGIYSSATTCAMDYGGEYETSRYFKPVLDHRDSDGTEYKIRTVCVGWHLYNCVGVSIISCGSEDCVNMTGFYIEGSKACIVQYCHIADLHIEVDGWEITKDGRVTIEVPRLGDRDYKATSSSNNRIYLSGFLIARLGNNHDIESANIDVRNCVFTIDRYGTDGKSKPQDSVSTPKYKYCADGRNIECDHNLFFTDPKDWYRTDLEPGDVSGFDSWSKSKAMTGISIYS